MMPAEAAQSPNDARIRAALWFAERGFAVFSVWSANGAGACRCPKGGQCDNPGKHPITPHGFLDATRDPERIRTMLSAASQPNYGLVAPDGVFILDVDGAGLALLAALEAELGPLPPTLRTNTAHGEHIFLRWPADLPRPIGQLFGFVTRWGSGHDAGYVIGPRSVHASGVEYVPAGDCFEIAELPAAWAVRALGPAGDKEPDRGPLIEIDAGGYRLPDHGYSGSRYEAVLRYMASRYKRGLAREEIWGGVVAGLAPRFAEPLSTDELRTRFERAWKRTSERLGEPVVEDEELPSGGTVAVTADWPAPMAEAAFHGPAGEITQAVAPYTEADPAGVLGTLLAMCGACMGHGRYIYQGAAQTANIFVVLVGETSAGRKGTAGSLAREVMSAAYPGWDRIVVAGLGSGEGLTGYLDRVKETEHRALVIEAEFGRLLTVMAREGSTLSPVMRDAWDGGPMGRCLAREQTLITWHHVGISAHITPAELREKMTSVDAAGGFGNRFLWLAVRRTRLVPFPESPRQLIAPFLGPLHDAIEQAQLPAELRWTDAAADRWEWLYAELAATPRTGLLGALTGRAEAQITRLALLYALLDRALAVDLPHLEAAEAVWSYAARSAAFIFGTSTGNRHADALRDLLAEGPVEWESAKKILGLRYAADLREVVGVLASLGLAEVYEQAREGGGRPRHVIRAVST
jgi:hypothetical protein